MKFLAFFIIFSSFLLGKCEASCPLGLGAPPKLPHTFSCPTEPKNCDEYLKYRTYDGTCNNLANPIRGAANYLYGRFTSPRYGDGISSFPLTSSGQPLPNARTLSLQIFGEQSVPDSKLALGFMSFGQVITHDLGSIMDKTEFRIFNLCCDGDGQYMYCDKKQKDCATLDIPIGDSTFYPNITCMDIIRSINSRDIGCKRKSAPVEQVTTVSAFADLSIVYGNSLDRNSQIRSFTDGKFTTYYKHDIEWPTPDTIGLCVNPGETCFLFGDNRGNQNPGLSLFQIFFLQEHNRLATRLKKINPSWNDEKLFQEARRINIAQYQHIVYYEYIPLLVGKSTLIKNKVTYPYEFGHTKDYKPINPSTLNEFSAGAFRFFHSQVEGQLKLYQENSKINGTVRLSDWFDRPQLLDQNNAINFELLGRGLSAQPQQSADLNTDPEIKHFTFKRSHTFGLDLMSIDITRGRDHGLGTYNDVREKCGLKRAKTWKQLRKSIPKSVVKKLKKFYETPEDVEYIIGGSLETPIDDFFVGPTFTCVITEQFHRNRIGDRFFYENGETSGYPFTLDQLKEIRKSSVARIYCDHVKNLKNIQESAFELVSNLNPLVSCSSIPKLDLKKWKE